MIIRLVLLALVVSTLVLAAGPPVAEAQSPAPVPAIDSLKPGAHVRAVLSADSATVDRFVGAVRTDTLFTVSCRSCTDTIQSPYRSLRVLEVEKRRRKIQAGATIGDMLLGGLAGAVLGAGIGAAWATYETSKPDCHDLCGLNWLAIPLLGAYGAGAGLVTGGIVGLTWRESYWVRVSIPVSAR